MREMQRGNFKFKSGLRGMGFLLSLDIAASVSAYNVVIHKKRGDNHFESAEKIYIERFVTTFERLVNIGLEKSALSLIGPSQKH